MSVELRVKKTIPFILVANIGLDYVAGLEGLERSFPDPERWTGPRDRIDSGDEFVASVNRERV